MRRRGKYTSGHVIVHTACIYIQMNAGRGKLFVYTLRRGTYLAVVLMWTFLIDSNSALLVLATVQQLRVKLELYRHVVVNYNLVD